MKRFPFLNILKTNCNSVQERVKSALSHTLLHLVFKILKLHIDQKYLTEQFEIFHLQIHIKKKEWKK